MLCTRCSVLKVRLCKVCVSHFPANKPLITDKDLIQRIKHEEATFKELLKKHIPKPLSTKQKEITPCF